MYFWSTRWLIRRRHSFQVLSWKVQEDLYCHQIKMILLSKITVSVLWNKPAPKWAVVNFGKSMVIPIYIRIPFNLNSLTSGKTEEPLKLNVVNEGRSWYYQREMKIPSSWIDRNFWNTTLSPLISKVLSFGSPLLYTVKQKLLFKTKFLV